MEDTKIYMKSVSVVILLRGGVYYEAAGHLAILRTTESSKLCQDTINDLRDPNE